MQKLGAKVMVCGPNTFPIIFVLFDSVASNWRSITSLLKLTKENFNNQSLIVRKQEVLIDEMKRYIENKEDIKNSLGTIEVRTGNYQKLSLFNTNLNTIKQKKPSKSIEG